MNDTVEKTSSGAIVYDTAILNQISDALFNPGSWSSATPVKGALRSAGRGNTMILCDGDQEFVLRHYIRGGVPGKVIRDAYIWMGAAKTRSFSEWRLLSKLVALGLPVPRPAAARYRRFGPIYRADLMTVLIPGIRSLADRIAERPGDAEFWQRIGLGLKQFHDAGVYHADLNAYNLQIDTHDRMHLLDFDRGRLLSVGVWQQKNLARLHRSLQKVQQLERRIQFSNVNWNQLLEGYFHASRSE